MQRLLLSLTLVSAVSLSAAGNSDVNSRSVENQVGSQASVSANRADKANILTRAATGCKDVFVNNARIFAHTGVAAITLPSIAYLAKTSIAYLAKSKQRSKLCAAVCGTAFGMYYTKRRLKVRKAEERLKMFSDSEQLK